VRLYGDITAVLSHGSAVKFEHHNYEEMAQCLVDGAANAERWENLNKRSQLRPGSYNIETARIMDWPFVYQERIEVIAQEQKLKLFPVITVGPTDGKLRGRVEFDVPGLFDL